VFASETKIPLSGGKRTHSLVLDYLTGERKRGSSDSFL
jgi:hypothetical protein